MNKPAVQKYVDCLLAGIEAQLRIEVVEDRNKLKILEKLMLSLGPRVGALRGESVADLEL